MKFLLISLRPSLYLPIPMELWSNLRLLVDLLWRKNRILVQMPFRLVTYIRVSQKLTVAILKPYSELSLRTCEVTKGQISRR